MRVLAYTTYVRLGYVSCTACHSVPTGGGLLTPYGRTVAAGESLFAKDSEFPQERLSQGLQARLLQTDSSSRANPFLMQTDYLASAKLTPKIRVDGDLGLALQRGSPGTWAETQSGWDAFVVRRLLLTGDLNEQDQWEVGRDFFPAGLNLDDHTSFLKSRNKRGITDYPTQVRWIRQTDRLQLMPYVFVPSYEEAQNNQETGLGFRTEYSLSASNSLGFLLQFGNSTALSRSEASGFFRLSQSSWNGLISETVFSHRQVHAADSSVDQWTSYIEPYLALPGWLETGWVYEYLHATDSNLETSYQTGPRVNLRIVEWFSILGDARFIAIHGSTGRIYYGQAFLHLQI